MPHDGMRGSQGYEAWSDRGFVELLTMVLIAIFDRTLHKLKTREKSCPKTLPILLVEDTSKSYKSMAGSNSVLE
jgi:hypothetical protein